MILGENTLTQSASDIYTKLNQNYEKLDSIDRQEHAQEFNTNDYFRSGKSENYDERDYQKVLNKFEKSDENIKAYEEVNSAKAEAVKNNTVIPNDEKESQATSNESSDASNSSNSLNAAGADISRTANLNKMLLETIIGDENAS